MSGHPSLTFRAPAVSRRRLVVAARHRLRALPLVSESLAALCHQLTSEVLFAGECVVRGAAQSEFSSQMWAVPGERLEVVELQATCLGAPFTARIHVRATTAVASIHLAALGGGDVAAPSRGGGAL